MSVPPPAIPLRMRLTGILLGMVFLFWLPFEDSNPTAALLLALFASAWAAAYVVVKTPKLSSRLLRSVLAGILAGAVVTPLAIFLMAFKTGLHSHQAPDFTPQQFISIINRSPLWLIGGFLIGLGRGIWLNARQT